MKNALFSAMAITGMTGLLLVAGCAQNEQTKATPTPVALAPVATPTAVPAMPTEQAAKEYVVKPGDNLWKISGDPQVLGDSFRWPLLFKANRDQIVDPDIIQPDQDLKYGSDYTQEQIDAAVEKAKETPPYHPHAAPRTRLPVNY